MSDPLWLASASPRRRQLLEWAGYALEVRAPDVDETRPEGKAPITHARDLARTKADTAPRGRVVVAADTIVHRKLTLFDKPTDRAEAVAHLQALSGDWHDVTTGVCIRGGGRERLFHVTTMVRFRRLLDTEIRAYVATGEADDKAGAYGIQGRAGGFVAELRGSWTNVMGLPLEDVMEALSVCGAHPWT